MTNHRIRRQSWHVRTHSAEAAFSIRQQLRTQLETTLLPAFESAFDALHLGDEVVHIPRLTLHLTLSSGENLGARLTHILRDKLGTLLQEAVIARPIESSVQRVTAHADVRRMFEHYLATGQIDWHANSGDAASLSRTMHGEAQALADEGHALFASSTGPLEHRIAASFRLLQLLASVARARIVDRALAHPPPRVIEALSNRGLASTGAIDAAHATADATMLIASIPSVLRLLAAPGVLGDYHLLRVQALLLALRAEDLRAMPPHIGSLLRECVEQAMLPSSTVARIRAVLDGIIKTHPLHPLWKTSKNFVAKTATATANYPFSIEPKKIAPSAMPLSGLALANDIIASQNKAPGEGSGYLAHDAGLILLHPFLARLFDALNVTSSDSGNTPTLTESALPRAAALLHWLLSGRDEVFEFELCTIKVLLGIAPERMLLVASGLLSDGDRAEANHMLATVITHWSVLGNTSVDGFRASFLQRRGLLRDIGHGWQLQIEPQSFDMLLGHLPWGIGIVKLPWTTKPIFTDWPTH